MWCIEFYNCSKDDGPTESRRIDPLPPSLTEVIDKSDSEGSISSTDNVVESKPDVDNVGKSLLPRNPSQDSCTKSDQTDDGYILVDHSDARPDCQSGSAWKRRLVRSHKLTMHTAFERPDNTDPAPVTALAISKDHRKVFIGDGRGRIYSWSVLDPVGHIADHWVKDEGTERCTNCQVKFGYAVRKHHCRNCGRIFCGKCTQDRHRIAHLRIFVPVRVCRQCFDELSGQSSGSKEIT